MKSIIAVLAIFGSVAFAADVTDVKVKPLDGFGGEAFPVCGGIGKSGAESGPDREIYRQVLKELPAASAGE